MALRPSKRKSLKKDDGWVDVTEEWVDVESGPAEPSSVSERAAVSLANQQAGGDIPPGSPIAPPEPEPKGTVIDRFKPQAIKDRAIGLVKGGLKTAVGIGKLNPMNMLPGAPEMDQDFVAALEPENREQEFGFKAEQISEYFFGGAAVGALSKAQKLGKIATASAEGLAAGGTTAAHGGSSEEVAKDMAMGAGLSYLFWVAGGVARNLGLKIMNSKIRPSIQDVRDGFKIETVEKYDLGGSLEKTAQRTNEEITKRVDELTGLLKESDSRVNLSDVVQDVREELGSQLTKEKNLGYNKQIKAAYDDLVEELTTVAGDPEIDLVAAQRIKRAAGQKGAWEYGKRDPESTARERVWNAFYTRLRQAIEASGEGEAIRKANGELSELIPVERALLRRIPVENRNNPLSLGDIVALANGEAGIFLATKIMKSGSVGNALMRGGNAGREAAPAAAGAVTGLNRTSNSGGGGGGGF